MTRQSILAFITETLRDILDNQELNLEESTSFVDTPDWDSLAFVTLMATLESKYSTELDMTAMQAAHTVGDVISLIEVHR